MRRDRDGLYRSKVFPGLWLDPAALLRGDLAGVLATLDRGLASPEHAAFVAKLADKAARADRASEFAGPSIDPPWRRPHGPGRCRESESRGEVRPVPRILEPQDRRRAERTAPQLVKFTGEFVWHHHEHEDELFLVVKGRFRMEFRDRQVWLEEGEFLIVPRGVEHRPVAEEEAHVLLFEPASTLNTGNVRSERTRRPARPDLNAVADRERSTPGR